MNVLKQSYTRYFRKYTPAWVTVILLGVVCTLCMALLPQLPQLIIDRIINPAMGEAPVVKDNVFAFLLTGFAANDYFGMFLRIAIVMLVVILVRYAAHYVRWNISHFYGVRAEKRLRHDVLVKLLSQSGAVLDTYTSGDLISICNSDPNVVKDFYSQNLAVLIDQFLVLAFATFFLCRMNFLLMIVPLAAGITASLCTVKYTRAMRKRYNYIRDSAAQLNSTVQENINGVRIVKAFATEDKEIEKFRKANDTYRDAYCLQVKSMARWQALFNSLGQIVGALSIILGVALACTGRMSVGEFATFLSYIAMITPALVNITGYLGMAQNAMICGGRMLSFLLTPDAIASPENPLPMPKRPDIAFSNAAVHLGETDEISGIDLNLPYGKKLGIMGKTGCGKSVLLKAMARLFDLSEGELLINGESIKNYDLEDVRRQFSLVPQDVFLFSETVRANIAFFRPEADEKDVSRAAAAACADGFINTLQNGYDTVIGERGLGLSGGQKQRISIARAILKDAPVIMLDDCTSALDMETEREILKNFYSAYPDRTLVIASHRFSGVKDCDEILYMENGRIVERGTHEQLVAANGRYCEVYRSQSASMEEALS